VVKPSFLDLEIFPPFAQVVPAPTFKEDEPSLWTTQDLFPPQESLISVLDSEFLSKRSDLPNSAAIPRLPFSPLELALSFLPSFSPSLNTLSEQA